MIHAYSKPAVRKEVAKSYEISQMKNKTQHKLFFINLTTKLVNHTEMVEC